MIKLESEQKLLISSPVGGWIWEPNVKGERLLNIPRQSTNLRFELGNAEELHKYSLRMQTENPIYYMLRAWKKEGGSGMFSGQMQEV